jgi:hypothetical protein
MTRHKTNKTAQNVLIECPGFFVNKPEKCNIKASRIQNIIFETGLYWQLDMHPSKFSKQKIYIVQKLNGQERKKEIQTWHIHLDSRQTGQEIQLSFLCKCQITLLYIQFKLDNSKHNHNEYHTTNPNKFINVLRKNSHFETISPIKEVKREKHNFTHKTKYTNVIKDLHTHKLSSKWQYITNTHHCKSSKCRFCLQ